MTERQLAFGMSDAQLASAPTVYSPELFKGKQILISGGGSGIGKASAWLYARLGAKVILCGRNMDKLQTAAQVMSKAQLDVEIRRIDIRNATFVDQLFEDIWQTLGGIDILFNNAGGQFPKPAIDISPNGWKAVIDNNLNGTWFMMQAAAKKWRSHGRPGNIINMTTVIDRGMFDIAHTCAARAGIIYTTKTVAVEWAPFNIRVNCIAPGVISSEGMHAYDISAVESFTGSNPMKRFGTVWEVAELVGYLGSNASNFMTGEVITLDGGGRYWGELWACQKPEFFKNT
ncbi:SDR family oxidoreductase [Microbulbifer sp. 2205BS26-8]|uniref:SDR family oxidoreductase n=1 Tax=Microbulbifer sp. 2205BS26-8 TaxID=3064386 RepID=UPI00273D980D|nr:SDR family oxidoreductase [Microbulbifer sp. 2205BS26-8]MDP5209275.1 SDR family oxidoreductase [Microbulbifer sp. 2205BS26-8]